MLGQKFPRTSQSHPGQNARGASGRAIVVNFGRCFSCGGTLRLFIEDMSTQTVTLKQVTWDTGQGTLSGNRYRNTSSYQKLQVLYA
jgi:hypothetical protein